MTITVFPVDAVSGAPAYTGEQLRQALSALQNSPAPSGRPLGATSGVRPGTPSTTVTATATTWTVNPHAGVLDLETSATAGPYLYAIGSAVTGSMTAANATNPRIDLISVQLSDPAEGDGTAAPGVAVVYTTGTAAATPTVPATPTRGYVLAQINVPTSGGGSPSVTWVAQPIGNPAAQVTAPGSTATQPIPSATQTQLGGGYTTSAYSIGGITYSGGVMTVPVAGLYRWEVTISTPGVTAAYFRNIKAVTTGTGTGANVQQGGRQENVPANSNSQLVTAGGFVQLNASDTLAVAFYQNSGASMTVTLGAFSLVKVA